MKSDRERHAGDADGRCGFRDREKRKEECKDMTMRRGAERLEKAAAPRLFLWMGLMRQTRLIRLIWPMGR